MIYSHYWNAPVAQRIEHHTPNVGIQVQFLAGALGPIAQLVARFDGIEEVASSSLAGSTGQAGWGARVVESAALEMR